MCNQPISGYYSPIEGNAMTDSIQAFGRTVSSLAGNPAGKNDGPFGQTISGMAQDKNNASNAFNRSIMEASLSVSESRGNGALALLYKTALEGINEQLKDKFGSNAIQSVSLQGMDVSPEATAERIVLSSTGFFDAYYANHQDLSPEEARSAFAEIIKGGIDRGFREAREILGQLQVLEGNIAANIDQTYDLVQQGLKAFVEQ